MKRNAVRIKQDPEREAANREGEQRRKKEKAARQANAEKQKRYRESMKAQGYKAKLVWEKPPEAGWVRTPVPVIRESSLNIAANNPAMKEAWAGCPVRSFLSAKSGR